MKKTIVGDPIWKKMRKGLAIGIACLGFGVCMFDSLEQVRADNVVVVIDPGHGGENEGGKTDVYLEKEMTLIVAEAMKTELEKYEGITVYMTRDSDVDMTLEERADFAKKVGADFLYSLHFNMSEYHELYGTECWISAFGSNYAKGYDFAKICNRNLAELGLANRGIKTRIGKKGEDYYGIIRHSTEREIPSCIIEHCHMDHAADAPYLDNGEWLTKYGILDATSVAQYFGLSSKELGVDYSNDDFSPTPVPDTVQKPDATGPEYLLVDSLRRDEENSVIHAVVSAMESDSKMMYYMYSTDGGATMTSRRLWPEDAKTIIFDIPIPKDGKGTLVIRVLNNYDLYTDSEGIDIEAIPLVRNGVKDTGAEGVMTSGESSLGGFFVLQSCCIGLGIILLLSLIVLLTQYRKRKLVRRRAILWMIFVLSGILLWGIGCIFLLKMQNKAKIEQEEQQLGQLTTQQEETSTTEMAEQTMTEDISLEENFYVSPLDEALKRRITGFSYPANDENVQISYDELRYVHVLHYDFNGEVTEGEMICHQDIALDLVEIFEELYLQKYPIEKIRLVDEYDADDEASMEDNNTSCFNYRVVYGTNHLSNHSYGKAIDINPFYNPYVFTRNGETMVQPEGSASYADRNADNPYAIDEEDLCYQLFIQHGFEWGGNWVNSKDYQHFEKK